MRLGRPWAAHPFLLALYSIVAFYAHNIGEIAPQEMLPLAGIVMGGALALFAACWLLWRDARKAGLAVTALLLVILFYGHFTQAFGDLLQIKVKQKIVFPIVMLLLGGVTLLLMRRERRLLSATLVLNWTVAALLLLPVISIASHAMVTANANVNAKSEHEPMLQLDQRARKPNVFFFIMDRYAASRTLQKQYSFDNSAFEEFLRSKGFYVATDSRANYIRTALSLASMFDMRHLNQLAQQGGSGSANWQPTYRMLNGEHRVLKAFRKLGYRYVHMGSWWEPTRYHVLADENYNVTDSANLFSASEVVTAFSGGTILRVVQQVLLPNLGSDRWADQCKRIPYQFAKLKEIAQRTEPTFVFAHILLPHFPYLFDASGRCMSREESLSRSRRDNYVGQVEYANKVLSDMVDTLLARAEKPIIIIQADEGPFPARYPDENDIDWQKATQADLQEKFRILNAMYLPGVDTSKLYNSMTSVNTFRLVFSEFFGAQLPPLEDRSFAFPDIRHLYDFFDVTDTVK